MDFSSLISSVLVDYRVLKMLKDSFSFSNPGTFKTFKTSALLYSYTSVMEILPLFNSDEEPA